MSANQTSLNKVKNRIHFESTKYLEIKIILNRLENEGFLEKIISLFNSIKNHEIYAIQQGTRSIIEILRNEEAKFKRKEEKTRMDKFLNCIQR